MQTAFHLDLPRKRGQGDKDGNEIYLSPASENRAVAGDSNEMPEKPSSARSERRVRLPEGALSQV